MKLNTDGLIIREHRTVEDDRLVTLLTRDYGVIRAFVRGAKRVKSRFQSSTQLFSYAKFSIYRGKDAYSIDEAQPIKIFFGLRNDIQKLSLAQYFCELVGELAPVEADADEYLRLMLNSLYMLSDSKKDPEQLKAIVELRLLCLSGYMPDLTVCADCGKEDDTMLFSPVEGTIFCQDCAHDHTGFVLPSGVLAAMRHICFSEDSKLFSFGLSDESIALLNSVTEGYLLIQTDKKYKTLDFYKTMKG